MRKKIVCEKEKIVMPIHPPQVESILKGTKKFEYRTRVAKREICSILVYATSPTKKVVAEVNVTKILSDTPENIWKKTKHHSGITKDFFDKHFSNRQKLYAYVLDEVKIFDKPKVLADYGINHILRSFEYLRSVIL